MTVGVLPTRKRSYLYEDLPSLLVNKKPRREPTRKRSYLFEDLPSPLFTKKPRRFSVSPIHSSPPRSLLDQLQTVFPLLEPQIIEKALDEYGNNLDAAIKSLNKLRVVEENSAADKTFGDVVVSIDPNNLPADDAGWVDLFVREMQCATSIDNAKARASTMMEMLKKSIRQHAAQELTQSFQKENIMQKKQIEVVVQENTILKHAVAIQHERQKELDCKNSEMEQMKQIVSEYHKKIKAQELNIYGLMIQLKNAEQSNKNIWGNFNRDVY